MPDTAAVPTIPAIYECSECGDRLTERRCPDCNLFARRIGSGGICPDCGEIITIDELLEATTN